MPQIKPYELQTKAALVPDVQQASPEAFGQSGKALKEFSGQVMEVADLIKKRQVQSDLSDIDVNLSKTQADLTTKYQEELQKGTLDTEAFSKEVEDTLTGLGDQVNTGEGRLHFNKTSAQLKSHFMEKAATGQAQLAGAKAKSNYSETLNNYSATLINDPSSFTHANQLQSQSIDNLVASGGLPAAEAEVLRSHSQNELAKASVRGWIKLNPQGAIDQLNSGQWDKILGDKETSGGQVKEQLLGQAEQAIKAGKVDDERDKRLQKDALNQKQIDIQNDFLQKIADDKLSTKEILRSELDPFGSGSKETFIRLLQDHEKSKSEKIKTDPSVFIDLWDKTHLPDGSPDKLVNENDLNKYMGRGLTVQDINTLRGEIQNKKTTAGKNESDLKKGLTDIAKGKLTKSNPLTGFKDPVGDEQYQKFLNGFITDYNQQRQAGKTPQQLLSPESPDYLGKNINQYVRSNQQIIRDLVKSGANQNSNVAPIGEEMIDVISPTGSAGRIPKSKLEAAKKAGFKTK